jgi:hypothetical protein
MPPAKKPAEIFYVPILKTKAGERWALSHLKPATRTKIRPLLEVHEHREKSVGEHLPSLCESLQSDWGTDRAFYLDAIWLHGDSGDPAVLGTLFTAVEEFGLRAMPVVRTTFDEASLEQVSAIVEASGRGCMLRVPPRVSAPDIDAAVEGIGIGRDKIDLLVDYRGRGMSLPADLPHVPHIGDWRRLIAASGTFPRSLTTIPMHTWHPVPRTCWTTYAAGVASGLSRRPIFADYVMRDPGAPPDFGMPSVNLRYALDTRWTVQIGGKVNEGASGEIHEICASLIASGDFAGTDFSAGDAEIERVADPEAGPGNSTQWIQWCSNHHIEHVVHQIAGV